jgi:hypothetical protein
MGKLSKLAALDGPEMESEGGRTSKWSAIMVVSSSTKLEGQIEAVIWPLVSPDPRRGTEAMPDCSIGSNMHGKVCHRGYDSRGFNGDENSHVAIRKHTMHVPVRRQNIADNYILSKIAN